MVVTVVNLLSINKVLLTDTNSLFLLFCLQGCSKKTNIFFDIFI